MNSRPESGDMPSIPNPDGSQAVDRHRGLVHAVQPGVSAGQLDDGLDLHGEPERQCSHPDG